MAPAGYSGTPLIKKLGIKEGFRLKIVNPPAHLPELLENMPLVNYLDQPKQNAADFIMLFCTTLQQLERQFKPLKKAMKANGMFWICWPKKTSFLATELDGNIVRKYGLLNGLVDVKVCAVDKDWSGLKFMYRLNDRK